MKKEKKSKKPTDPKNLKKKNKKEKPSKKKGSTLPKIDCQKQSKKVKPIPKNLKEIMTEILGNYQSFESLPRFYGGDIPLYISEINTLCTIGKTPNINLTTIAFSLGVSKSAISKSTNRLLEKELITKEKSPREVLFKLTALGKTIYNKMDADDRCVFFDIQNFWDTLKKEDKENILHFLTSFNHALKSSIDRIKEPLDKA